MEVLVTTYVRLSDLAAELTAVQNVCARHGFSGDTDSVDAPFVEIDEP